MLHIAAPHGATIEIPTTPAEETICYPGTDEPKAIRSYYDAQGYVVVRGAISAGQCDTMRATFEAEVKPFDGYIYRQASASPERHVLTEHGFMLNSILNVHAVDPRSFPTFRKLASELITSNTLKQLVRVLHDEAGTLVQSMYFEGNPSTWAHQDTYYLDSEQLGRMTAVWIALEDIAPGAGRFFVYPKSHRIDMGLNRGDLGIARNHDGYKRKVLEVIATHGLECRAPALRKGDVLFWNARTIHGSMETRQPEHSRSSMTAHYIPSSTRFMQYQARPVRLDLAPVNGMLVHHAKDLRRPLNRFVLQVETRFPKAFSAAKRAAIAVITR
jgi:phytanoyl-CoA hydroxylase